MTGKYTPGPWVIEFPTMAGAHRLVIGSDYGSVAAISLNGAPKAQDRLPADHEDYAPQIQVMQGNAFLIAAAPTMLSALDMLCTYFDEEQFTNQELERLLQTGRNAIFFAKYGQEIVLADE